MDLSDPEDVKSVCNDVKSQHGNPTIVFNNAGIANHHTILDLSDARIERLVAVNQLAHYRIAREFLPAIAAANHGMFVTVASLAGFVVPAGLVDYCGSKAAAVAFHEGLASELVHRYNAPTVRTICVCPNFARTKLAEGFVNKSNFVSPTLDAESVAEAVFEKVVSGDSGFVVLPKIHYWVATTVRAWPYWMQMGIAKGLAEVMRPYNKLPHKDDIHPELRKLWVEGKLGTEDLETEEYKLFLEGKTSVEDIKAWAESKASKQTSN